MDAKTLESIFPKTLQRNLGYAFLRDSQGNSVEVRKGDKVSLINPKSISQGMARRSQYKVNLATESFLGKGLYDVQKIKKESSGNIVFQVEKNGRTKILSEVYLTKG